MIFININKRCTKVICFAISMDYSVCPVQVLIEWLTIKLTQYGFNHCFAIVDEGKFWSILGFPKMFCSISFSFINGCVIKKALCSDGLCSKIVIGGDPTGGSLVVSAYNKIIFSSFSFLNHGKGETNEPVASKNKASYCETKLS